VKLHLVYFLEGRQAQYKLSSHIQELLVNAKTHVQMILVLLLVVRAAVLGRIAALWVSYPELEQGSNIAMVPGRRELVVQRPRQQSWILSLDLDLKPYVAAAAAAPAALRSDPKLQNSSESLDQASTSCCNS